MLTFTRIVTGTIAQSFAIKLSGAPATKEFGASTIFFDGAHTEFLGLGLFGLFVCVIIVRT